jgi:uncharacterized damage-inducible protein DinB
MTSPAEVLREAFTRHTWATLRLLDHLETLDPSSYEEGVAGTFGPIMTTLTHLVDAEDRYLQRLEHPALPPYVENPPQPLDVLRDRVLDAGPRWAAALDLLEAGDLTARIPPDRVAGGIDPAETLLLLQALHHGDDHRAQVCSTLGALGLEVPDLDVWSYWASERTD